VTVWLTADQHFGHDMVAQLRGFRTAHKHDKEVMARYNDVVGRDDEVYIVGDLCMWGPQNKGNVERIIRQLNGRKHLILGNHDKLKPFDYVELGILSVHTWIPLNFGYCVNLVHDPSAVTMDPESFWICGHMHDLFKQIGTCVNVGLDVWDLRPVEGIKVWDLLKDAKPTKEQHNLSWLAEHRHEEGAKNRLEAGHEEGPTGPSGQLDP